MEKQINPNPELHNWAENLTKDVYNEWSSKYSYWEQGFRVFNGPISYKPSLVIISLNPGGGSKSFIEARQKFESNDFSLPLTPPYYKNNKMSNKIRNLFEQDESVLKKSVTFPLVFFRSRNWAELKKEPKHREMENFSYQKVTEILQKVNPNFILVLGIKTHKRLKKHIMKDMVEDNTLLKNSTGTGLAIKSKWNNTEVFSIAHPTGFRISNDDWGKIKELFWERMKDNN